MKKKVFLISIIIVLVTIYGYYCLRQQEQKHNIAKLNCETYDVITGNNYNISFSSDSYSEKELINSKVSIIKNGKVSKTFNYKENDDFYSIDYVGLQITDSIKVKIQNDVYYIHDFKNKYIKYRKHSECELVSCKINNFDISCRRGNFIIMKKYR